MGDVLCLKRTKLILIATILLSGCSTTNNESNNETKSVPEEMEASKYVGTRLPTTCRKRCD